MKYCGRSTFCICAFAAALLVGGHALQAQKDPDPIAEHLFPPDLIKVAHKAIGLTEDQVAKLKTEIQTAQERIADLEQRRQDEMQALVNLLKKDHPEEKAVLDQSDKVSNLETEIKQTHLVMLVRIKNTLTVQQQAKLKEVKGSVDAVQAKMERVKAAVQRWEKEGRDLSVLAGLKRELDPLLQEGKFKEAEAVLDRAIRLLEATEQK
jgi:Spy/CpxP family protein refolding chaperone